MKFANYNAFQADFTTHGVAHAAERTARLGFDAVEFLDLCPAPRPIPDRADAAAVRRALAENGLTVACYSLGADLLTDDAGFDAQMEKHIAFASEVGSPFFHHTLVLSLVPDPRVPSYDAIFETVAARAIRIAERCRAYGLTCLYEPQGMYFNGVDGLFRLFDRVRQACPNVGICGDVANSLFVDVPERAIYDAFLPAIRHVHVKDLEVSDRPFDGGVRYRSAGGRHLRECALGRGNVDLAYCFRRLAEAGYDGAVSLELGGTDEDLTEALAFARALAG